MPAGFGYGAIGGAVRSALGSGGASASRYAMRNAFSGGVRGASGMAAALGGDILRYGSGMSNAGLSAVAGGLGGGLYGAMSDDTSVLGGALMGAGLGAGGYGAVALGRRGLRSYGRFRGAGMGRGQAASNALGVMGDVSREFVGSSYNRAVNGFSALKSRFGR